MARSKESFNKREKERKRLKQKQEKQEKLQQRKAQPGKSGRLEDMMAYIDENGNITSTPPTNTITNADDANANQSSNKINTGNVRKEH
jgi:hypothetical protein